MGTLLNRPTSSCRADPKRGKILRPVHPPQRRHDLDRDAPLRCSRPGRTLPRTDPQACVWGSESWRSTPLIAYSSRAKPSWLGVDESAELWSLWKSTECRPDDPIGCILRDRKSTRLNSSNVATSYAV